MNRGRFRGNRDHQHRNKSNENADDSNPVIKSFLGYADELSDKHDRHERIVKFSRDITIESKRLIFLLHTVDMRKPNAAKILNEAFTRLTSLCCSNFMNIAKELDGLDQYQYTRAYSAGLQEFIEAFTYYDYLHNDRIMDWKDLQQKLTYTLKQHTQSESGGEEAAPAIEEDYCQTVPETTVTCLVQPTEFMLGLADLSGEIMRKCINSLGSGDIDTCHTACNFVQKLYSGYIGLSSVRNKEMNRKIHAMYQSVLKVEKVCYNVKVRGSEAAVWGSSDNNEKDRDDDDEGFANY